MPSSDLAVLTGDIVRSSRLPAGALDAGVAALAEAAEAMAGWPGAAPARFTRFRGDGWQCLAPAPVHALRAALFLRARLRAAGRGLETRASVGIGPGVLPAGDGLAAASGPAFELSGRGLDAMDRGARLAVAWTAPPAAAGLVGAVFGLCDAISRRWTPRQAEIAAAVLPPAPRATQASLAAALGVSQPVVARHLDAAGDGALAAALAAVEEQGQ